MKQTGKKWNKINLILEEIKRKNNETLKIAYNI